MDAALLMPVLMPVPLHQYISAFVSIRSITPSVVYCCYFGTRKGMIQTVKKSCSSNSQKNPFRL